MLKGTEKKINEMIAHVLLITNGPILDQHMCITAKTITKQHVYFRSKEYRENTGMTGS